MAIPTTKATFKSYCLRALGSGVIDINISDDQADDRIDEALQYFSQYHYDSVERMYLKHLITTADIVRARADASTTGTDKIDTSITATWKEGTNYIPVPDAVISVLEVFPFYEGSTSNMFDVRYQMRLNDLYDFSSTSVLHYNLTMQHIDHLQHVLVGEVPIRFNQHQNRLYLDMDWSNEIPSDQYFVIECYRKLDPTTYTDVYNDIFLKKYATALIKKQWGANLIKFNGVSMLGGVQINGETIYTQADEEIKLLEEQLLNGYGLPADMMIG